MMRTKLSEPLGWLDAERIARLCNGRVVQGRGRAKSVSTDTRTLGVGDCFVALSGENFDGQQFVRQALQRGAAGVVVRSAAGLQVRGDVFVVEVPDTLVALHELAAEHRRCHPARVIGITGSCGKTSTKEMLGHVLERAMVTVRSPKSFNNHIGVPLTLFLLEPRTQAAVVEIGTSAPGEVARLTRIAQPDVAIVTCVGESHLAGLGSVDGVAREKAALVQGLRPGGLAILNGDDKSCRAMAQLTPARSCLVRIDAPADWFATDTRFHGLGTTFMLQGERPVTLPTLGTHNVYNALFTIAAASELGLPIEPILEALCTLPPTSRRLEPKVVGGVTIFDDTYNMNPASARAGLGALAGLRGKGRRLVVFGEMLELGAASESLHLELGAQVARQGIDVLLAVGAGALPIAAGALAAGMPRERVLDAPDVTTAEQQLLEILLPDDCVLCKASRRIGLERLVDALVGHLAARPPASRGGTVRQAAARLGPKSIAATG